MTVFLVTDGDWVVAVYATRALADAHLTSDPTLDLVEHEVRTTFTAPAPKAVHVVTPKPCGVFYLTVNGYREQVPCNLPTGHDGPCWFTLPSGTEKETVGKP